MQETEAKGGDSPALRAEAPPDLSTAHLPRLDEVAGSSLYEVTVSRPSGISALEAQEKGTSHGPLCDRFGWKEIPGVRACSGRTGIVRGTLGYSLAAGLLAAIAAVASDPGDRGGGIPHRGCCEERWARGEGGAGDAVAQSGCGRAQDEDRPSRRESTERGLLPDRPPLGAHSEHPVARVDGHQCE